MSGEGRDGPAPTGALVGAVEALGRLNEALARFGRDLAAVLVALMTALVLVGVVFRYGLDNSLAFTEDASVLAMIWLAFLTAPFAFRHGGHVAIEMGVNRLPDRLRRLVRVGVNLLILWLLCRFFAESLVFVRNGWLIRANTIPLSLAWFRGIVPVSLALMGSVAVELVLRDLLAIRDPGRPRDVLPLATVEPE